MDEPDKSQSSLDSQATRRGHHRSGTECSSISSIAADDKSETGPRGSSPSSNGCCSVSAEPMILRDGENSIVPTVVAESRTQFDRECPRKSFELGGKLRLKVHYPSFLLSQSILCCGTDKEIVR